MIMKQWSAIVGLLVVTILWGLTFPLIRRAVGYITPSEFVAIRLLLSALLFSPLLWLKKSDISPSLLWAGFIFGSLEAATYFCQTTGIQTISSSESAFITSLSVVIAPLLAPLFGLSKPTGRDWLALLGCLVGIFILTGARLTGLAVGVYWSLACALFYALSVNYLSRVTEKITHQVAFVGVQLVMGLPLPVMSWVIIGGTGHFHWIAVGVLLFCAMTTITSYYLQTRFQRRLPVSRVMMIYAMEPVFATIFGFWINGEAITHHMVAGGAIVVASFLLSQFFTSFVKPVKMP